MAWRDSGSLARILYLVCVISLCLGKTCASDSLASLLRSPKDAGIPSNNPFNHDSFKERFREKCQSGDTLHQCYTQISQIEPFLKSYFINQLRQMCPPTSNGLMCFYDFMSSILRPEQFKRDSQSANGDSKRAKTANYMLCPATMDTIVCFDNYMALWLNMVSSKEGKRTFGPGKRNGYGIKKYTVESRSLGTDGKTEGFFEDCLQTDDYEACEKSKLRQIAKASKMAEMTSKRSVASLCQDRDPIVCFEHYLTQLVRSEGNKQKVKGFVG